MVMPANQSNACVHFWAGKHPGKIGWLIGPSSLPKTRLRPWMPYALDNDAFSAFSNQTPWDEAAWFQMITQLKSCAHQPLWCLCPDVVADKQATLQLWEKYCSTIERVGFLPAFAVQDGMIPKDVPSKTKVIFVGGSTSWKWRNIRLWTDNFPRVHVGRVNSLNKLWTCEELGVESVDGTGWFKGGETDKKARMLSLWMNGLKPDPELFSQDA